MTTSRSCPSAHASEDEAATDTPSDLELPNLDPNVVEIGDIVQYVWGMPGPDFDEGRVTVIHEDGSFDIYMDEKAYGGPMTYERERLSDRNGPVGIGYCAKVTRKGVNGF